MVTRRQLFKFIGAIGLEFIFVQNIPQTLTLSSDVTDREWLNSADSIPHVFPTPVSNDDRPDSYPICHLCHDEPCCICPICYGTGADDELWMANRSRTDMPPKCKGCEGWGWESYWLCG